MSAKKLTGKVAVVTGGARGIGRGYAIRLAQLGCDVAIIDRNLKSYAVYEFAKSQMTAPTVMDECKALGVKAMGFEVDLSNREETECAITDIIGKMGHIDIVVCNAGGGIYKFADEVDPNNTEAKREGESGVIDLSTKGLPSDCPQDMLIKVFNNNLMSCIYTCMAVAPYMKKQNSGKIVTMSSIGGIYPDGRYFPYGVAKSAIIHYTSNLAKELRPYNINVNCIAPGGIKTGRVRVDESSNRAGLLRPGTIEDCTGVLEFLVTELSSYVTGQVIVVDGGEGKTAG